MFGQAPSWLRYIFGYNNAEGFFVYTAISQLVEHVIHIPQSHELLLPIREVVSLQLLAYHIAVRRGCDVDQPRNLAKSVTVE